MFNVLSLLLAIALAILGLVLVFRGARAHWSGEPRQRLIFVRNKTRL